MKKQFNVGAYCIRPILAAALGLALALTSCGKKENVTIAGTYLFGNAQENGPSGSVEIYPLTDSSALFHLELSLGAPSYNSGEATGQMAIKDGIGTYAQKDDFGDCTLKFKFAPQYVDVTTEPGHEECGFGFNVSASNKYELVNKSVPEYFINSQGDTIFFKSLVAQPRETQPAAKPDTLYITETSYVQIWITADDYVDETGDGSFYMGNALGKVEELGIKGVSVDKDSYVSFALAGGKQHIINSNDNRYAILLYKKGQKPIYLDLGSEMPITDEVYKYLGINPLEDAIIRIVKAIQNKDEKALNEFIPQDGITLMHYPVGMMPAYDNFSKISFDEQTSDALVLGSIDITDFKVHFEELPSYDCDKEHWNKSGIYASTTEDKGKNYSVMVVGKEGSFEEFFLNFSDGKWWLSTIYRPDLCGA